MYMKDINNSELYRDIKNKNKNHIPYATYIDHSIACVFADNGEFYPGYPGYGDYFPDGQPGPGGVNFLPPGAMDQMHQGTLLNM